ncbi:hypothetical protein K3495_g9609 [Podosphaera aphanis]|nr:hypothetical protein K3495_g9609 [Podosphaera aphanis]
MSTPAAKRRRLDAAHQILSKPFRSPFKTPNKTLIKGSSPDLKVTPSLAKVETSLTSKNTNPSISRKHLNSYSTTSRPIGTPSRGLRSRKNYQSPVAAAVLEDQSIVSLLRIQRELEKRLREVTNELETAEQAKKIETNSRSKNPDGEIDEELRDLIFKWTMASRQAAEELFSKVRDRVNRMGGPRVWKEMERKRLENFNSWDQEEEIHHNENDPDDSKDTEKRDIYAEYSIDPETENEKSQKTSGFGDTGELPGEEDDFTMAMMLRTMNIDLDIIGYDRYQHQWVD